MILAIRFGIDAPLVSRARQDCFKFLLSVKDGRIFNCFFSADKNRQMQCEYASLPDSALYADEPAVRRHDVFDQTQPQSVATNLRRGYFFATIERLEDAFLLGRRDAQPAIRDSDLNLFADWRLYRFRAQPDPATV